MEGVFGRLLRTVLSSFGSNPLRGFAASRFDHYRINSRVMTPEESALVSKHMEAAFAQMDGAFMELGKAFDAVERSGNQDGQG